MSVYCVASTALSGDPHSLVSVVPESIWGEHPSVHRLGRVGRWDDAGIVGGGPVGSRVVGPVHPLLGTGHLSCKSDGGYCSRGSEAATRRHGSSSRHPG